LKFAASFVLPVTEESATKCLARNRYQVSPDKTIRGRKPGIKILGVLDYLRRFGLRYVKDDIK
jgi:hypothetical protein